MASGWADRTLKQIGAIPDDAEIPLAEGALALAHRALPTVDPAPYREHIAALGRATAAAHSAMAHSTPPSNTTASNTAGSNTTGSNATGSARLATDGIGAKCEALYDGLVVQHRYKGDAATYDDLDNTNLFRVIDRRRGLPVALGILYIVTGRSLGWNVTGLNFPGHFLIQVQHGSQRRIVDPFDGLRRLDAPELRMLLKRIAGPEAELSPEHYSPVSSRDLLLRLENNRKLRLVAKNHLDPAIAALEGMLLITPADPGLWHECGVLHSQVGNVESAIHALENAHWHGTDTATRNAAETLLRQLRPKLS